MSGWLTKATGALRGEPPEQPIPFESVCQCGVRHSGLRRRKPQRIICRSCGSALFVLPRDSYPTPAAPPPRPKKKRKQGARGETEPPAGFQQVATNVFQASGQIGRSAANAGVSVGTRLRTWLLAFLALWTPLRLVLAGCLVICGLTVLFVLSSDRSEQAVMDLKVANEAARTALDEHDIATAAQHLSAAVVALDRLERHDDPLSREIRQLNRETIAIRDSLPVSPLQIVAEAETAHGAGKDQQWAERFRAQYGHRWMIVDGLVSRNISGDKGGKHAVKLPLRFGTAGRGAEFNVDLADLELVAKGGKPRRAVFAVQLVSCELSADQRTWRLGADPQSAFLWGTIGNYHEAGFAFDTPEERQEVERMLAAQMRILGVTTPETGGETGGAQPSAETAPEEPAP
jgi:hypothetical protein